ncbi:hypothetical protein BKH46_05990 [Helicobacter sp. 12S02634-8]|uniref:hypothetical protein n=1 Tax=Helicobacter sp. 12S02634-8 TaxID=1476199 RepID=UPI000BA62AEE|nr:hypothetical protein [Helicobacter sp. 12S02634-8]PAF46770.1 hypothetical protein BKH46_05990 [Helicobacter sp. 12S02634-8]
MRNKLTKQEVYSTLIKCLKKANYQWWNEELLVPDYTNEVLSFLSADTIYAHKRISRSQKTIDKLVKTIFQDKNLLAYEIVFINGEVYWRNPQDFVLPYKTMGT